MGRLHRQRGALQGVGHHGRVRQEPQVPASGSYSRLPNRTLMPCYSCRTKKKGGGGVSPYQKITIPQEVMAPTPTAGAADRVFVKG
jgi:hypothetical protein